MAKPKKLDIFSKEGKKQLSKVLKNDRAKQQAAALEKQRIQQREIDLYALANDYSNLVANQDEVRCIWQTVESISSPTPDSNGIIRDKEYYKTLHAQYYWASKYMYSRLLRSLREKNISLNELKEFMTNDGTLEK